MRTVGWMWAVAVLATLSLHAEEPGSFSEAAVRLPDGTRVVGRVVAQDENYVELLTAGGVSMRAPRESVEWLPEGPGRRTGAAEVTDPDDSRLMLAPTGRPLRRGTGYVSDHYLVFPGFSYGLTDNVSLSGGLSTIPSLGLREQLFYLSPKVGARLNDSVAVSAGLLYVRLPWDDDADDFAIGFVVGTFGRPGGSLTAGVGVVRDVLHTDQGYYGGSPARARHTPLLLLGGEKRLSKRLALVSESWLVLDRDFRLADQPLGLSLRLKGDRLSADVGFVVIPSVLDEGFPIPWLSVSYHFGRARGSNENSRAAPPALRRTAGR